MAVMRASFLDLKEMAHLASNVVSELLPFLPKDEERVYSLLKSYVSDNSAMLLVSKHNGVIRGGALAITTDTPYAAKKHTQLVGLFTDVVGDGCAMMSQIVRWYTSRSNSLMVCYAAPADTRLDKLLNLKFKLERHGTMLVRRRYNGISQ